MLAIHQTSRYLERPKGLYEAHVRYGWFMYLLAEIGTAIERDAPKWDADAARAAQRRMKRSNGQGSQADLADRRRLTNCSLMVGQSLLSTLVSIAVGSWFAPRSVYGAT
jgi:hypothetical protein